MSLSWQSSLVARRRSAVVRALHRPPSSAPTVLPFLHSSDRVSFAPPPPAFPPPLPPQRSAVRARRKRLRKRRAWRVREGRTMNLACVLWGLKYIVACILKYCNYKFCSFLIKAVSNFPGGWINALSCTHDMLWGHEESNLSIKCWGGGAASALGLKRTLSWIN